MIRRNFLSTAVKGMAGLAGLSSLFTPNSLRAKPAFDPSNSEFGPRDEKFWELIREQFPLTHERIYLNTGGLGASPYVSIKAVQKRMDELEEISETGHSEELWRTVKEKASKFFGCDPDELAYIRNTTEGVNIVCNGLPLKEGDEVITSTHEHVGNTISWLARQRRDGIRMKVFIPSMQSAQENIDRIEKLITARTRAISLAHVTTATGQVMPVKEIGKLAAAHNLWYFLDGAQSVGMMPLNMREIGCHAYATSGHKWLIGPKGTGLIYVRKDALDLVRPKWVGAYSDTGESDMRTGEFTFNSTAQRYEYGTVSAPLFVGLGAAMDFLLQIGIDNVWQRDHALGAALIERLNEIGANILSPQHPDEHSAMITFNLKNIEYQKLQTFLAEKFKLRTRGIYEGGLNAIRISPHIYNSFDDINRVIEGAKAAQKL